jgi:UDP-GlcNAc:undecaprenyl-phosphate GlcNAc-1-phosphate transferase
MSDANLGIYLIIALLAMAISMVLIPLMMRLAPVIGMIDYPDPRKVHAVPVPRVGGVGLVVGAMLPMLIWLPHTPLMASILLGGIILLIFGVWDDIKELGHYAKFLGQFIAVILVVYYGGLYIEHFPYIGFTTIPASIGKPFTVIVLVGVINALNHSDGLDGLAGGESLLSFGAIAYLAYLYSDTDILIISSAAIGGIFGFLRFNSHPARVFMGDGGSQFIGYCVGILTLLLTQKANPVLSPALPLLLVGLPIVDIVAVFILRAKGGMNLFRATRNHIHHRLLDLGFYHYESVMLIYSIQAFFVICAISFPYENDLLITGIYLVTSILVFVWLTMCERRGFRAHKSTSNNERDHHVLPEFLTSKHILALPQQALETGVMVFLIGAALMSITVPLDIAVSASVLLVVLLLLVLLPQLANWFLLRLVVFVSIGFAVYLSTNYPPQWLIDQHYLVYIFFAFLAVTGFLAVRLASDRTFKITPLDYLVVIALLFIAFIPEYPDSGQELTWMALQMIVLFYASELILQQHVTVRNRVSGALIAMLSLVALRGLL